MSKKETTKNIKKENLVIYAFFTVLAISALLILAGFLFAKPNLKGPFPYTKEISGKITQIDENTRKIVLKPIKGYEDCLMFYCNHSYIHIYAEDELLYSLERSESIFGRTPGGAYHFIDISNVSDELTLYIEAVYPQTRNYALTFYQGDGVFMYSYLLKHSLLLLIVNFFNLFFSLLLLILCLIGIRKYHFNRDALWFCIFSFLISLWALNATPWMTLMFDNRTASCFMEYLLLMLLAPSAALYIRDVFEAPEKKSRISTLLIFLSCANILLLTVLHITGIREFKETATVTHIIIALVLVYSFTALFRHILREGLTRTTSVAIVSTFLLAFFYVLDLAAFYTGKMADIFGWLGISLCLLIMGVNIFFEMFRSMEMAQKNAGYREMAIRDVDTGLYNKNGYNSWMESTELKEGLFIITYDLNELKRCNDVFGHLAGDQYIKDAASIFKELFSTHGLTFRLGGDEFLTVVPDQTEAWVQEKLSLLEEKTKEYNKTSEVIDMKIAYGYARYSGKTDKTYEDTRHRADERMYLKKGAMKNGQPKPDAMAADNCLPSAEAPEKPPLPTTPVK